MLSTDLKLFPRFIGHNGHGHFNNGHFKFIVITGIARLLNFP